PGWASTKGRYGRGGPPRWRPAGASLPLKSSILRLLQGARPRKRVPMNAARLFVFVLVGLVAFASPVWPAGKQTLEIASKSGVHVFAVEIADNDAERAKGLMYRKELPEGQGMLFDFHREQEVSFWMQNTYIPLDMVFIRADGRILRIAENTEPLSTKLISSGGPGGAARVS